MNVKKSSIKQLISRPTDCARIKDAQGISLDCHTSSYFLIGREGNCQRWVFRSDVVRPARTEPATFQSFGMLVDHWIIRTSSIEEVVVPRHRFIDRDLHSPTRS